MASVAMADATATTALPVLAPKLERADLNDAIDVPGYSFNLEHTLAEEKRVRRQFDLRVLPICMCVCAALVSADWAGCSSSSCSWTGASEPRT